MALYIGVDRMRGKKRKGKDWKGLECRDREMSYNEDDEKCYNILFVLGVWQSDEWECDW